MLKEKLLAFDPELPLERARTLPSDWYFDAEIYEAERRSVFARTWQVAGRVDQVNEAGKFFTADLAGEPVVVVRGSDGVLRGFFNVCRHRAARVAHLAEGQASRFRCRYHGWTYDLAGRLRGTPEFDGVAEFCREREGLVPVEVDVWGPAVWVRLQPDGLPLTDFLAPLPGHASAGGLAKLRFVGRRQYTLQCNWKVFVDNYLDGGYHVNTIHPGLAGVLNYAEYRTECSGYTSVQSSPLRPAGQQPTPSSTASVRTGDRAYYWWVFPNFMMNAYEGVMDTNLVLPTGPRECRVIFDFYFANTEGPEAKHYIEESIAVADQIQREDMEICEDVQRGLGSSSYDTGRFSVRREAAGYQFHQLLARQLIEAPSAIRGT